MPSSVSSAHQYSGFAVVSSKSLLLSGSESDRLKTLLFKMGLAVGVLTVTSVLLVVLSGEIVGAVVKTESEVAASVVIGAPVTTTGDFVGVSVTTTGDFVGVLVTTGESVTGAIVGESVGAGVITGDAVGVVVPGGVGLEFIVK